MTAVHNFKTMTQTGNYNISAMTYEVCAVYTFLCAYIYPIHYRVTRIINITDTIITMRTYYNNYIIILHTAQQHHTERDPKNIKIILYSHIIGL